MSLLRVQLQKRTNYFDWETVRKGEYEVAEEVFAVKLAVETDMVASYSDLQSSTIELIC